jgi:transaldolase
MRLLLDSADVRAWERHGPSGIYRGITTNPLLLRRAQRDCNLQTLEFLVGCAVERGFEEIHVQAWGESLVESARRIADLGDAVRVKLPATAEGFSAACELGCPERTTLTAIHNAEQVLAASAAGVAYAAAYYARLAETGADADGIFDRMRQVAAPGTRILVASLRTPAQMIGLADRGFDCFAVPEVVADALLASAATDRAVADFEAAARG